MTDERELIYLLYRIHDGSIERSYDRAAMHEIDGDLFAADRERCQAAHHRAEAARYWAHLEEAEADAAKG